MEEPPSPSGIPEPIQLPPQTPPPPPNNGGKSGAKKVFGPVAALVALLAKTKGLIIPILKTGGTMLISIAIYAYRWGWQFAVGFVLLIFVHECGHLLVARRHGLKVGAPMFIPFVGALIALKEMPRNAWIEAQVGIGGPILGAVGAAVCYAIYLTTGNGLFCALAYVGFMINLFNLAPIGFLDGGRIVTALSPWFWVVGTVIMLYLLVNHFNPLLLIILIFSLPRLFSLFRKKTGAEQRYYEVTPTQRWVMGLMYFGLIAALVLGMMAAYIPTEPARNHGGESISYLQSVHAPST